MLWSRSCMAAMEIASTDLYSFNPKQKVNQTKMTFLIKRLWPDGFCIVMHLTICHSFIWEDSLGYDWGEFFVHFSLKGSVVQWPQCYSFQQFQAHYCVTEKVALAQRKISANGCPAASWQLTQSCRVSQQVIGCAFLGSHLLLGLSWKVFPSIYNFCTVNKTALFLFPKHLINLTLRITFKRYFELLLRTKGKEPMLYY